MKLTPRQQQILDLIRDEIRNTGFPPTRAEIAKSLGFRSVNAAEEHLKALARKGAITIAAGASRGIRLNENFNKNKRAPEQMSLPIPSLTQMVLPLIGRVAAGSPILAQEHVEKTYQVDYGLFSEKPDYFLKVRGMSMRDIGIFDGDLLAVKKTEQVRNGQIVVARIGDEVTVKRFQRRGARVELHPENPDFEVITVQGEEDNFAIEGIAVGLFRDWS